MADRVKIDKEEFIRLLNSGLTDASIASLFGVSRMTISRRRESLGISPKPKRPKDYYKISEVDHNKLLSLYNKGCNDYEVATIMHMGRNTLRKWRLENKITSQSNKKGLGDKDAVEMYRLYQGGTTIDQIARIHGVNRSSVSRLLRKNKLVIKDNRVMPTDVILSSSFNAFQEQVLIGELFGDGGLQATSESKAFYYTAHTNNQDFFTLWKYSVFNDFIVNVGEKKDHSSVRIATWSIPYLKKWYDKFYPNGVKNLTPELASILSDVSLAVWYMGDGSLNKKVPTFHVGLNVDLIPVAEALTSKFSIKFEAVPYENEWHLKVREADKFFNAIAPYCIRGFEYKLFESYEKVIGAGLQSNYCAVNSVDKFKELSAEEQEVVLDQYVNFYQKRGFPYPRYNLRDIKVDINSLHNSKCLVRGKIIQGNTFGVKTCNHYFPHRFDGRRYDSDPMSIWEDRGKLKDFFRNRFKYADNRISDAVIRTGIQLKGVPANFNPSIAQYIYQEFLPEYGTVLDFSAGYGGRLLGFLTSKTKGNYYGYEPNVKSYNALVKMSNELTPIIGNSSNVPKLFNVPFEDASIDYRSDLVFSSPPYYGLELYSDEDSQSILRYPDYGVWLDRFWKVLVDKCSTSLYPGGYFIYTIGNYKSYDLIKDTVDIVKSFGMVLQDTYSISYHNVFKNVDKLENVLIFKK